DLRDFHSFPTRRSSDLEAPIIGKEQPPAQPCLTDDIDAVEVLTDMECETGIIISDNICRNVLFVSDGKDGADIVRAEEEAGVVRSEEHTSELQSRFDLV